MATVTNLLTKYASNKSKGCIETAKRVICYLNGTDTLDIAFHSNTNYQIHAFIKLPIRKLIWYSNANLGPQDQSVPKHRDISVTLNSFNLDHHLVSSCLILGLFIVY